MSVAGDHAQNDMAGSEKESWKSVLEDEGFQVKIILRGLAEYDDVVKIWISHLKEAWNRL
jgi:sirohydrochlorin cobaltochelatase